VVSVTGDGSLGLARADDATPAALAPPPPVRRYEPIESTLDGALRELGPGELLLALTERLTAATPAR
jgi:hypothetical protein